MRAVFVVLLLTACGQTGPDPLTQVLMTRDEIRANQHRRLAECHAHSIELASVPGDIRQQVVASCIETHQQMLQMEAITLMALDKRIAELSP